MFSPPWVARTTHARSSVGPLVCERYPCAMIRSAFWTATAARQSLQFSAPSAAAARSWLMRFCWALTPTPDAASAGGAGADIVSKDAMESARTPAGIRALSLSPTPMQRGPKGRDCDTSPNGHSTLRGASHQCDCSVPSLAVPADDVGENIDTALRVVDRHAAVDRGQLDHHEVGHGEPGYPVEVRRGRPGCVTRVDREVAAGRGAGHGHVHDHAFGRGHAGNAALPRDLHRSGLTGAQRCRRRPR